MRSKVLLLILMLLGTAYMWRIALADHYSNDVTTAASWAAIGATLSIPAMVIVLFRS